MNIKFGKYRVLFFYGGFSNVHNFLLICISARWPCGQLDNCLPPKRRTNISFAPFTSSEAGALWFNALKGIDLGYIGSLSERVPPTTLCFQERYLLATILPNNFAFPRTMFLPWHKIIFSRSNNQAVICIDVAKSPIYHKNQYKNTIFEDMWKEQVCGTLLWYSESVWKIKQLHK